MKPASRSETAPAPAAPNETVRTIISLLVIIHLFVIGLAVMTSSESGASTLLREVKERPRFIEAYLTQLWLDRGYDYYLMNDQNWDFHLEATFKYADGHVEGPIFLPDTDLSGERRQRYQQLAGFMGLYIARGNSEEATALDAERKLLLPETIGGSLLKQNPNAKSVSLKCIFHRGINPRELNSENPKDRDPDGPQYYVSVADMTVVLDHRGRPVVFENMPVPEVSPVRRPDAAKPAKPASPTNSAESAANGK